MNGPPKINIIGAGSAAFSTKLIRDLSLTPSLDGSTVSLMDLDADRLAAMKRFCEGYAADLGMHLVIETTTERRRSFEGAD